MRRFLYQDVPFPTHAINLHHVNTAKRVNEIVRFGAPKLGDVCDVAALISKGGNGYHTTALNAVFLRKTVTVHMHFPCLDIGQENGLTRFRGLCCRLGHCEGQNPI